MSKKLSRGIRKRGAGYQVDVSLKGVRRTATVESAAAAEIKRTELLQELMGSEFPDTAPKVVKVWTLGEAYDRTLSAVWSGTRSEHTASLNANAAVKWFGRMKKLDAITTDDLDAWVVELQRIKNGDGTINRKLAALSKMFSHAQERCPGLKKPHFPRRKESKGRIRYFTDTEEDTILATFKQFNQTDYREGVIVLIDTGMRFNELQHMKGKDIDPNAKLIHVWENKADLPRSIPMTSRVLNIITSRVHGDEDQLFTFSHSAFINAWDRVRGLMGFGGDKQFIPHTLRHTCASRLVQRGVSLKVVQEWLGHKNITTTMRYAHLSPTSLLDAVAVLERKPDLKLVAGETR